MAAVPVIPESGSSLFRDPAIWVGAGGIALDGILYVYFTSQLAARDQRIADLESKVHQLSLMMGTTNPTPNYVGQVAENVRSLSKKDSEEAIKALEARMKNLIKNETEGVKAMSQMMMSRQMISQYDYDGQYALLPQQQPGPQFIPGVQNQQPYPGQSHLSNSTQASQLEGAAPVQRRATNPPRNNSHFGPPQGQPSQFNQFVQTNPVNYPPNQHFMPQQFVPNQYPVNSRPPPEPEQPSQVSDDEVTLGTGNELPDF